MPLCPQITNTPITVTQTGDFTVTSVIPAVSDTIDGLAQDFDNIVVQLDDKTKAYYQNDPPTEPGLNEGDIWFDTNDGNKQYFYTGTAWVSVQDTAIAAAASAASAAQTTADGKNRVFRQGPTPTATAVGDIWFNTSSDNAISRWDGSSWVLSALGTNALANFSANKITSGSIDASVVTVSNLNAGNISTGTLAADRIATGSLNADKITSNTITASQIATNTITATQIAASTITATQINSLNGAVIGGYTISATKIEIPSIGNFIDSDGKAVFSTLQTNTGNTVLFGGPLSVLSTISASGTISSSNNITATNDVTASRDLFTPNHRTVSDAANGRVTVALGRVTRSTASSQRYKEHITPIRDIDELDPKRLLDIPVRAFVYRNDYLSPSDSRSEALIPGFIAEEVDAIYPVAADYEDGNVESWHDRMILPGMLALIQDLYKEIELLKGE